MYRITPLRFLLSHYGKCHAAYSTQTAQKIGIIGLGNVGSTVCSNLLKSGYAVSALLDTNPKAGQDLPGDIPRPGTPRELAAMCDIVLTALPAPPHVKQVLTGENGVFAGLRSGGVWIDHSTTDYQQTLELAKEAGVYSDKQTQSSQALFIWSRVPETTLPLETTLPRVYMIIMCPG